MSIQYYSFTIHFQSVALFDYQSGQMVQRWTGHNQAVTKVYIEEKENMLHPSQTSNSEFTNET